MKEKIGKIFMVFVVLFVVFGFITKFPPVFDLGDDLVFLCAEMMK